MPDSRLESRGTTCNACAEYQRGDRDNITYAGMQIHACSKIPDNWLSRECPCGCVITPTEPGGDTTP